MVQEMASLPRWLRANEGVTASRAFPKGAVLRAGAVLSSVQRSLLLLQSESNMARARVRKFSTTRRPRLSTNVRLSPGTQEVGDGRSLGLLSRSVGPARIATARPLRSYRFPLLLPLPDVARSPRLPPDSLFSFDHRWSIFLRPLSCFCFATRTPNSGGRNPSTCPWTYPW
jgi:hypothetical protein